MALALLAILIPHISLEFIFESVHETNDPYSDYYCYCQPNDDGLLISS